MYIFVIPCLNLLIFTKGNETTVQYCESTEKTVFAPHQNHPLGATLGVPAASHGSQWLVNRPILSAGHLGGMDLRIAHPKREQHMQLQSAKQPPYQQWPNSFHVSSIPGLNQTIRESSLAHLELASCMINSTVSQAKLSKTYSKIPMILNSWKSSQSHLISSIV